MSNTTRAPEVRPADSPLEIVVLALHVCERIPDEEPVTAFPPHFARDALRAFTIERSGGGFVANVAFDLPQGLPDTIGTKESSHSRFRPTGTHSWQARPSSVRS